MQFISYFSQGDGYFTPYASLFNHTSSQVGVIPCDFNGDNNTDVVQFWEQNKNISIASYLSTGNGSWTFADSAYLEGTDYMTLFSLDIDGDNKQDILQTWNNNKKMAFVAYLSQGNGSFTTVNSNYDEGNDYMTLFPLDFNGDKKVDVLQTYNNGGQMGFVSYQSNGDGTFTSITTQYNQGRSYISIFPIDFNSDGKMDVLQTWDDRGSMSFVAYLSQGNGSFSTVNTYFTTDSSSISVFPMDIDGDGRTDVSQITDHGRTLNPKVGIISYLSQGDATFKPAETNYQEDSGHIGFFPLDIDGDSKIDILQTRNENGQMGFVAYFGLSSIDGFYKTVESAYNATNSHISLFPLSIKKRI